MTFVKAGMVLVGIGTATIPVWSGSDFRNGRSTPAAQSPPTAAAAPKRSVSIPRTIVLSGDLARRDVAGLMGGYLSERTARKRISGSKHFAAIDRLGRHQPAERADVLGEDQLVAQPVRSRVRAPRLPRPRTSGTSM